MNEPFLENSMFTDDKSYDKSYGQTEESDNQYSYPIRTEEPDHNLFRETKCGCLSNSCRELREVRKTSNFHDTVVKN